MAMEWHEVGLEAMKAILDLPNMDGNRRVGFKSSWGRIDLEMADRPGLQNKKVSV